MRRFYGIRTLRRFFLAFFLLFLWGLMFLNFRSLGTRRYRKAMEEVDEALRQGHTNITHIIPNYNESLKSDKLVVSSIVSPVLLLSYQRTGSSFISGIFGNNSAAFLLYEPLDMLYTAMYGIRPGWAVPGDIFYTEKGNLRDLPHEETAGMVRMLRLIYSCRLSDLPVIMLIHPFWSTFRKYMPQSDAYLSCMEENKVNMADSANRCINKIRFCPRHFSGNDTRLALCRKLLWDFGIFGVRQPEVRDMLDTHGVRGYFKCVFWYTSVARACARQYLDKPCEGASIRAVKTVRAPMSVGLHAARVLPSLVLVHSLRDPRGTVLSRLSARWTWAQGERDTFPSHAGRYCPSVGRDHALLTATRGQDLQGRALTVVYDKFVREPGSVTREVYGLLGRTPPRVLLGRLEGGAGDQGGRSVQRADAWKKALPPESVQEINNVCKRFFKDIPYPWPNV